MSLFNRFAQLTLYAEKETRIFKDLRISFDIEKNSESTSNTGKIMIYNLNKESHLFVQKNKLTVGLDVGYIGFENGDQLIRRLYTADVKDFTLKKDSENDNASSPISFQRTGPDVVLSIECGEGEVALTTSRINKSYSTNVPLSNIIDDLIKTMGVPVGSKIGIPDKRFINGLTLSGNSKQYLDALLLQNGLEWTIQNNEMHIYPQSRIDQTKAVLLNPDSGLIDIPTKTRNGASFRMLINPLVKPGVTVKIESNFVTGFYLVKKAIYKGDTHGGEWTMEVEGVSA